MAKDIILEKNKQIYIYLAFNNDNSFYTLHEDTNNFWVKKNQIVITSLPYVEINCSIHYIIIKGKIILYKYWQNQILK